MALPKPRDRVVNFRLSAEEYESIYITCLREGYRTMSEFARAAVLGHVQAYRLRQGGPAGSLLQISSKLDVVLQEVRDLRQQGMHWNDCERSEELAIEEAEV